MKIGDLYQNKHTHELRRVTLIEDAPMTKTRTVTVVQLDDGSRWGITPLTAHWDFVI